MARKTPTHPAAQPRPAIVAPKKLLVANRSEIAIRIMRAATELGLRTVAIYAQEDRFSMHRFKADEAYLVGEGKGPVGAYLDIDGIVALAKEKGVERMVALSTRAVNYLQQKGGYTETDATILSEERRTRYEGSGRNSKILVKELRQKGS